MCTENDHVTGKVIDLASDIRRFDHVNDRVTVPLIYHVTGRVTYFRHVTYRVSDHVICPVIAICHWNDLASVAVTLRVKVDLRLEVDFVKRPHSSFHASDIASLCHVTDRGKSVNHVR